jgi:hypothetical protein
MNLTSDPSCFQSVAASPRERIGALSASHANALAFSIEDSRVPESVIDMGFVG